MVPKCLVTVDLLLFKKFSLVKKSAACSSGNCQLDLFFFPQELHPQSFTLFVFLTELQSREKGETAETGMIVENITCEMVHSQLMY